MSQAGSILRNSGPGGFVQTLNHVPPIAGNIDLTSTGGTIAITPNIGFGTVNLEVGGVVADSFNGNTGTAIPVAGVVNIVTANSTPIFAGAGNTLTLDFNLTSNLGLGSSLPALTTGTGNLTYGRFAGQALTSGLSNILIGVAAGAGLTTGSTNVFIGQSVAAGSTATGGNVGIGIGALLGLTTGLSHTAIGASSHGLVTTGSFSTCLGSNSGAGHTGADSSNICIGYNTIGTAGQSNTLRIGNATGVGNGALATAFICGIDGVNVGSVATVVTEASNKLGTATITGGTNITITPGANTITISDSQAQLLPSYSVANATPYVVTATDFYITVDTTTIPITIQLPNAPTNLRRFIIKDSGGMAATNNVTVTTVGGVVVIDAAATFVMNTNYQAIELVFATVGYQVF